MSTQLSLEKGPDAPLLHETIGVNLAATVARQGDTDALVSRHQNVRYTYRELWDETERVARGLLALGISKGDRIGIWSPNCAEWTLVQFATARHRGDARQREPRVPARRARCTRCGSRACGCS